VQFINEEEVITNTVRTILVVFRVVSTTTLKAVSVNGRIGSIADQNYVHLCRVIRDSEFENRITGDRDIARRRYCSEWITTLTIRATIRTPYRNTIVGTNSSLHRERVLASSCIVAYEVLAYCYIIPCVHLKCKQLVIQAGVDGICVRSWYTVIRVRRPSTKVLTLTTKLPRATRECILKDEEIQPVTISVTGEGPKVIKVHGSILRARWDIHGVEIEVVAISFK
jgi:hypothetical protein